MKLYLSTIRIAFCAQANNKQVLDPSLSSTGLTKQAFLSLSLSSPLRYLLRPWPAQKLSLVIGQTLSCSNASPTFFSSKESARGLAVTIREAYDVESGAKPEWLASMQ